MNVDTDAVAPDDEPPKAPSDMIPRNRAIEVALREQIVGVVRRQTRYHPERVGVHVISTSDSMRTSQSPRR